MKRSSCLIALAATVIAGPSFADDLTGRVDALFAPFDADDTPGGAVGVIRDGELIHARGYGMADLEHGAPNTPDTLFYIASTSKQFTAACVLDLVSTGKIGLGDDVRQYIPEIPDYDRGTVTVRHLLNHRSGLRDFYDLLIMADLGYEAIDTNADVIDLVASQADLDFDPGTDFAYSNTGYLLLGELVERLSGRSLRDYADANLFEPLGMTRSHFRDDHREIARGRAVGHQPTSGGFEMVATTFDLVGPGGVLTSVNEMALWARHLMDLRARNDAAFDLLSKPPALGPGQYANPSFATYGMGMMRLTHRGIECLSSRGGAHGYRAELLLVPDHDFAVIVLGNTSNLPADDLALAVADIYLEAPFRAAEAAEPLKSSIGLGTDDLRAMAGIYRNPETNEHLILTPKADHIKGAILLMQVIMPLIATSPTHLENREGPVPVALDLQDTGSGGRRLIAHLGARPPITFEKVSIARLSPDQLAACAGTYTGDEVPGGLVLEVAGGRLALRQAHPLLRIPPFIPTSPDVFITDAGALLEFDRDADGAVKGVTCSTGRARGVRFAKTSP